MVIEIFPNLKLLDNKKVLESEKKDIEDASKLRHYLPLLMFSIERFISKIYKEILHLSVKADMFYRLNNGAQTHDEIQAGNNQANNLDDVNFNITRCVKRVPPLSDLKDYKVTIDGIFNLVKNMYNETLLSEIMNEAYVKAEFERYKQDLKENIIKEYREVRKYKHAVAYLEKELKFPIYPTDQTFLFVVVKIIIEQAKKLYEQENEKERLLTCLKFYSNIIKRDTKNTTPNEKPNILSENYTNSNINNTNPSENVRKSVVVQSHESLKALSSISNKDSSKIEMNRSNSSKSLDDDTVVVSEDQIESLASMFRDEEKVNGFVTESDIDESVFITKSTAKHYEKWNKLFSKSKEEELLGKATQHHNNSLLKKALQKLHVYTSKKRKAKKFLFEKKKKYDNIKARSFYVKKLLKKSLKSLKKNKDRRNNIKKAIKKLRKLRKNVVKMKCFMAWKSQTNFSPPKQEDKRSRSRPKERRKEKETKERNDELKRNTKEKNYESEGEVRKSREERVEKSDKRKIFRKSRSHSVGPKKETIREEKENVTQKRDKYVAKEDKKKNVLMVSAQKIGPDYNFTPEMIEKIRKNLKKTEAFLQQFEKVK
ncbi:hypothetical protein ABK040_016730 [Willaertia magna]